MMMSFWTSMALLVLVSFLTGIGQVSFKITALRDSTLFKKLISPPFLIGLGSFLAGPVFANLAASAVPFSLLYAMTSLNFVFILIFARSVLGEPIDARKIAGVATIVAGLVLMVS
jgi:drug/metabolite transporter (DMT)-like permease